MISEENEIKEGDLVCYESGKVYSRLCKSEGHTGGFNRELWKKSRCVGLVVSGCFEHSFFKGRGRGYVEELGVKVLDSDGTVITKPVRLLRILEEEEKTREINNLYNEIGLILEKINVLTRN